MTVDLLVNPAGRRPLPVAGFRPEDRAPLSFHRTMPGYAQTPLHDCPALAERLGVARVLVKDESSRLGLPSFKILGASWATVAAVRKSWLPDADGTLPALRWGLQGVRPSADRSLVAATDGNHGRGVARMAALLGLASHVLVPAGTAAARIEAIEGEGACVEVVDGTYDDAVAASAALGGADALVVSDTSWPGYEDTPRAVVEGYSTIFHEVDDAVRRRRLPAPTVLAVQAGVGSFAAAALRHYRRPNVAQVRTVVVEPRSAACLLASAANGKPTLVPGPHRSAMAGLNCGLPSSLAWPLVRSGTDVFLGIDDEDAFIAMRLLAESGIVAGESGAAALGGLLAAVHTTQSSMLGLEPDTCVLVVNTEGATDPSNYTAVVGNPPGLATG